MNCQTKTSPETFGKEYFSTGNYTDYDEREPRYHQTAREIFEALSKIGLLRKGNVVVDYGCGYGFLVSGLNKLGVICYGYETSKWAASKAALRNIPIVVSSIRRALATDMMIALDVFEHMDNASIKRAIHSLNDPKAVLVRIPVATSGDSFHLQISRNDPTHINCKTKELWLKFFKGIGYGLYLPLHLFTIYDSPGVMAGIFIRL